MSKFVSTRNKGFFMEFENGFGISVQYGIENYCEKKNGTTIYPTDPMKHNRWDSISSEIAVFEGERMLSVGDSDNQVIGWLGTDDVAKIITIVQSAHSDNEEEMVKQIKELGL